MIIGQSIVYIWSGNEFHVTSLCYIEIIPIDLETYSSHSVKKLSLWWFAKVKDWPLLWPIYVNHKMLVSRPLFSQCHVWYAWIRANIIFNVKFEFKIKNEWSLPFLKITIIPSWIRTGQCVVFHAEKNSISKGSFFPSYKHRLFLKL